MWIASWTRYPLAIDVVFNVDDRRVHRGREGAKSLVIDTVWCALWHRLRIFEPIDQALDYFTALSGSSLSM
ncbi:hypothetical protein LshimejAT787_1203480 [Lyophyllum shimeji]|uniref:Uncharacterized protein n=1 Tax=Lyophyllum shimeji TaxID=47721 RepID=A0A9P3PWQ6_LYOSH|nr:hypothetical protein LshimejAT787_1203480 [Lyophyllum shimeji]